MKTIQVCGMLRDGRYNVKVIVLPVSVKGRIRDINRFAAGYRDMQKALDDIRQAAGHPSRRVSGT